MMVDGLVSIIMPSWNTERFIAETIQSVIDQTYTNWELIIVDDCSSDNTDEVVASFKDERIKYLHNEKNSGAALTRNKLPDRLIVFFTTLGTAMPSFVLATLLLLVFCLKLGWIPVWSSSNPNYLLPIIALAAYPMAYITRLTKTSMLDALNQDYIRTARAKGVHRLKVIFKHALKNALIPVVTYVGPMVAYILTGSMVVENIFTIGGLGTEFVTSIVNRDYTMIMAITIFLAVLMVVANLLTDIAYKLIDPRITFE